MKKIFLILFSFILILFLTGSALAQEATSTATPSAKIEYQLPYPGILPDSPLYFLKAARDRIIGFLIADPLKKAEFNLLVADKRLNAGVILLNKRKNELALSTISKGENYFEQAIKEVEVAKRKGQDTKLLLERLRLAAKKHQQILENFKEKAGEDLKDRVERELERAKSFEQSVEKLLQ